VPTPSLQQARNHHRVLRRLLEAAKRAARATLTRDPRPAAVATTVGSYQFAAATYGSRGIAAMAEDEAPNVNAQAFPGWTAAGFPLTDALEAVITEMTQQVEAEVAEEMWRLDRLVASEVADTWRQAEQAEFVSRPEWQNYVRMLTPPSCSRCAILAGRIYRDLEEFKRHPGCDCVMIPVQDWQEAHDKGLVSSFEALFEARRVRGLSKADEQAIRDGADPQKVINARRGNETADVLGHRLKVTTEGTTRRSAWRRANPDKPYRLRPEAIYKIANGDRDEAIRLLRAYGYIT
jgi:hypothetical protein